MAETRTRPPPPKPPPMRPASAAKPPPAPIPDPSPPARSGKFGWLLGWIVVPLLLFGALFLGGVHVGARYPDMWLSRATLWAFDREPQLGPETDADRQPMSRRIRLAVLPRKDHSIEVDVTDEELAKIAKAANVDPASLDCEALCRALWIEKNPDREFLGTSQCKLTPPEAAKPPAKPGPTKLECDALVQR